MAEHVAVTRIKHGDAFFDRGDVVTTKDVGKDAFAALVDNGALVEGEVFDELFPEHEVPEGDAPGSPSNLGEVEGTELAAPEPKAAK